MAFLLKNSFVQWIDYFYQHFDQNKFELLISVFALLRDEIHSEFRFVLKRPPQGNISGRSIVIQTKEDPIHNSLGKSSYFSVEWRTRALLPNLVSFCWLHHLGYWSIPDIILNDTLSHSPTVPRQTKQFIHTTFEIQPFKLLKGTLIYFSWAASDHQS